MRIPKDEYSEILTPQEALAAQLALKDMTKEDKNDFIEKILKAIEDNR